ncbi:DUF317 domain-containing protein [Streptomyces sp. NPDC050085]|uniref:DUF317 domain-containing protein n=1 Tax=Streptomyces sp. NPDC050085 TaxID=3365600 RepID=UPI003798BF52
MPDDGRVHVSPRYLAGQVDDPHDEYLRPLVEKYGWKQLDDGADTLYYVSPCLRVRLTWTPELYREPSLQIGAHADPHPLRTPLWHIAADCHLPTEFLTALTTVVANALTETPDALLRTNEDWMAPLPRPRGWRGAARSATSPDSLAHYTREPAAVLAPRPGLVAGWTFTAALPDGRDEWQAQFSTSTPRFLVEAFHRAVTAPEPVIRYGSSLSPWTRPYLATWPVFPAALPPPPPVPHAPATPRPHR